MSTNKSKQAFTSRTVAIIGASAVLAWGLSLVVIPVIQGAEEGFDPFASICRAIGIGVSGENTKAATAKSPSQVTFDSAAIAKIALGDAKRGAAVAEDFCVSCHNPNGSSPEKTTPSLTGQSARALYKQLWDMKNGSRTNEAMTPLLADLSDEQITDLAAYYSGLRERNLDFSNYNDLLPVALPLVTRGDAARALPACDSCHEKHVGGPLEAPNLMGQYPAYTAAQLHAYAKGERKNDLYGRMRTIARKLTDKEIEALGAYYDSRRFNPWSQIF